MIDDIDTALVKVEKRGDFVIHCRVQYLPDVHRWEPRIDISRVDGKAEEFIVPCGPECYRRSSDEAFTVGWAIARQWLDGGRIPWKPRRVVA